MKLSSPIAIPNDGSLSFSHLMRVIGKQHVACGSADRLARRQLIDAFSRSIPKLDPICHVADKNRILSAIEECRVLLQSLFGVLPLGNIKQVAAESDQLSVFVEFTTNVLHDVQ